MQRSSSVELAFIVIVAGAFVREYLITSTNLTPNVNYKQNTPEPPELLKMRQEPTRGGTPTPSTPAWELLLSRLDLQVSRIPSL